MHGCNCCRPFVWGGIGIVRCCGGSGHTLEALARGQSPDSCG